MKGLFLTLKGHRPGRDEDGWRETGGSAVDPDNDALDEFKVVDPAAYPDFVKPVPRLGTDVAAMQRSPCWRFVCPSYCSTRAWPSLGSLWRM
jgi:hypothetical protein